MDLSDLNDIIDYLHAAARSVGAEVTSPWFYLQFGLMLAAAGIAFAADAGIRARIDLTSFAEGWPLPLRHFARVLVASASTAVFAILVIVARVAMYHSTWPSRSYLLMVAAKLALAWLVIRLVTSVIRNAFLVKLVSVSAWCVAALSIIGQLDPAVDALDSDQVAVVLGGLRLTPLVVIKLGAIADRRPVADQHRQQFRRKPHQPLRRPDAVDPGAAGEDDPDGADGDRDRCRARRGRHQSVGTGGVLRRGRRRHRHRPAKDRRQFHLRHHPLADKSVKPGDLVTIGDSSGRISAMKTRYISVAAGDGREFLIPNEDLVTQKVTNWTYTDKNTLVKVNFGTNYDADPRLVCKLAIDIAAAAPRAIKSRTPNCILVEFAEAGMKFSLTFWIADPDGMDNVKSEVMLSLWETFKREGIRVPYPVREIRVRGGALPVETTVEVSS